MVGSLLEVFLNNQILLLKEYEMKQEHLGDGAYITVNRDFIGQVIFTANHHDDRMATDKVHMSHAGLLKALEVYRQDLINNQE